MLEANFDIFIIHKPSLGSSEVPQKIWARLAQPFWRLLDTNKSSNWQAKYMYRYKPKTDAHFYIKNQNKTSHHPKIIFIQKNLDFFPNLFEHWFPHFSTQLWRDFMLLNFRVSNRNFALRAIVRNCEEFTGLAIARR